MRRLPVVPSQSPDASRASDLLRWPVLGRFLRWRHARRVLQIPLLVVSALLVLHGLLGPRLAPKNLATVVVWVHYRGALVLALLAMGNLFCMACPFMLPRDAVRRWWTPRWHWPRVLRNKWLAIALLVGFLFGYECLDWWSSPRATAWLIVGYFAVAFAVDVLFRGASFCKYVCPIGQFNFAASTVSPREIRIADERVCATCTTHDCLRGRDDDRSLRGCELALFQPRKQGNTDCTFCLDCVHACPHDNVMIASRIPGSELWIDPFRSGVGRFSRRADLAALVVIFTFGALLNAFGMVSPVYAVERWLAARLHVHNEAIVLAVIFVVALGVIPAIAVGGTSILTRATTKSNRALRAIAVPYAYSLAPIGLGMWAAHYTFHFLTGLFTVVPVAQRAVADLGRPLLGAPRWSLSGLPAHVVYPMEIGFIALGLVGSGIAAWRIAEREDRDHAMRAFAPWAAVCVAIACAAWWLMSQPMEMRGTFVA